MPDWRVPESLGWPKKCKNVKVWPNTYILIKTSNQKMSGEKSLYISQGYRSRRKFEIKAKKISAWKRTIFWVALILAVVSKTLRLIYKIFTKYYYLIIYKILLTLFEIKSWLHRTIWDRYLKVYVKKIIFKTISKIQDF